MILRLSVSIATFFLVLLYHVVPLNGQSDALQGDINTSQVVCDPREYGASPSLLDNAKAIQDALDACAKQGGGRVPLSNGTFASGPLIVTGTNVVLEIGTNAILDMAYPPDTWPVDLMTTVATV
jgi:polygalacturonase